MKKGDKEQYKVNDAESKRRVSQIYALLMQGYQRKKITEYAFKHWGIKERQADEYTKKAKLLVQDDFDDNIEYKRTEILAQYYDLYNKNYEEENYQECRNVLKQISDVLGVSVADIKVKKDNVININLKEVLPKQ